jgi:peptide chain release factor 1
MIEKRLEKIAREFEEISLDLTKPEVINDRALYQKITRKHFEYTPIVEKYRQLQELKKNLAQTQELAKSEADPEMKEMARQEIFDIEKKSEALTEELKTMLIPKDPDGHKNAIMEIRAGTGGDEAGLFAGDLFRMYSRYAEIKGFKIDVADSSPTELGGFKEIIFMINGPEAYANFKYEAGTHRVQRVPKTETSGRVHTSAVTVAVLPEQEEYEFQLKTEELRIEVCRASGAGGQHVNKTESAVRIVHIPTGLEVYCQDGRSQIKNKAKAMSILGARVKAFEEGKSKDKLDQERRSQIGSGDRSEKIRTYNFPQNRMTDHRIGYTLYNLAGFMEGDLDELIMKLKQEDMQKRLTQEE